MSTYISRPVVSKGWETISHGLTRFVNNAELVAVSDVIVYCFDDTVETWESDPAAWYSPKTREICVNMTKVLRSKEVQKYLVKSKYRRLIEDSNGETFYILGYEGLRDFSDFIRIYVKDCHTRTTSSSEYGILEQKRYVGQLIERAVFYDHDTSSKSRSAMWNAMSTILGVIVHETGHSVSSDFILEKWWSKLASYERQVLTLMEELRTESMQIDRLKGESRNCLAKAYSVVLDLDQQIKDLESYSDEDGVTSEDYVSAIAVNSTLVLGRTVYGGYSDAEVGNLALAVEMAVGPDRYDEMFKIWKDYCNVKSMTETAAKEIAKRWCELFPPTDFKSSVAPSVVLDDSEGEDSEDSEGSSSDSDSETKESHIIVDGDSDASGEKSDGEEGEEDENGDSPVSGSSESDSESSEDSEDSEEASDDSHDSILDTADAGSAGEKEVEVEDDSHSEDKDAVAKSMIDAIIVVKREIEKPVVAPYTLTTGASAFKKISSHERYKKIKPPKEDFEIARQMTHALQKIYVTGKDRFHVDNDLPPGRLKSRAAVQNAAYRKQGVQTRKQQWERTRVTVSSNPQLTVGIMTDVSGSQSWAESLSSRTSWILSKAFRTVNARTGTVAFGERVYMPSVPGKPMNEQIIIRADQGTEMFDVGLGALDHVLKLTNNLGVKMLFVLTDSIFVAENENAKANQWVKILKDAGCKTIWIFPEGTENLTPPDAIPLPVNRREVVSSPSAMIEKIIKIIETELSDKKGV